MCLIWQKSIGIVKAGVGGVIGVSGGRETLQQPAASIAFFGGKAAIPPSLESTAHGCGIVHG